jgi:hypothetical protein
MEPIVKKKSSPRKNMVDYDYDVLISNPRVSPLDPPSESDIKRAEEFLGRSFPTLMRRWIADFGSLQINPEVTRFPKLLLLGLGPSSTIDDNIVLFNQPDNPSRPPEYLVFAHEFDGENDIIYALRADSTIASVCNYFAFPYFSNKADYAGAKWNTVFESLDEFWSIKVQQYLNW